jgi:hypothetical protein
MFLFSTSSKPTLEPTCLRMQRVPGAIFTGVKRPGREADCSSHSSAEIDVKYAGVTPSLPYAYL